MGDIDEGDVVSLVVVGVVVVVVWGVAEFGILAVWEVEIAIFTVEVKVGVETVGARMVWPLCLEASPFAPFV